MFAVATLILALLMTSAMADDYRSFREAYAGVDWPNSITTTEQCQRRVADVVARFGFTDSEVGISQWTGGPDLRVKDQTQHFRIAFSCDPKKRMVTIDIAGDQNQTGSAGNLLDRLMDTFNRP
jgi:hypothetical protein